jgi:enoyl-CoA hydratase/3-hydroxyacyl-CoA dehydrogenase
MHAVRLLEDGEAAIPTIDAAAKQAFEIGMGPFELMNVTGLAIALDASTTLARAFGPLYAPPELLARRVHDRKTWDVSGPVDPDTCSHAAERLMAAAFYAAAALVDEGVGSVEDTDIGARVGLRWRRGPFELMNDRGIDAAAALVDRFAAAWRVSAPALVSRQRKQARPFPFRLVRSESTGGIATLTINRPDAMNALNEAVVAQLAEAFHRAVDDSSVRGIVIAGAGQAFVAGADVRFFIPHIEARDLDRIVRFTRAGQDLLREIHGCPKPVVARMHGLALGGGLELALVCHAIVATPKASMAFPETGLGIYPALGGTQRTTRRVGKGLAKWLVLCGEAIGAAEALEIGLVDRVVSLDQLDAEIAAILALGSPPEARRANETPARYRAIEEAFAKPGCPDAGSLASAAAGDPLLAQAAKRLATKAPIALRIAADLIDRGATLPIEQALDLESAHLIEIFSTRDALEGLTSLGTKRPIFVGK